MSSKLVRKQGKRVSRKRIGQPRSIVDRIRAISIGDAADATISAASALSRLVAFNVETKYVDTGIGPTAVDWTGVVYPLSLLAQGATSATRDGDGVRAHGLELTWTATCPAAAINACRAICFADTENQGVLPTSAQVLQNVGASFTPLSAWNHDNLRRFCILYDSGPITLYPSGDGAKDHRSVIPVNHHVRYFGAAGAIANAKEGNLFLLLIGDSAAAGALMAYYTRFNFVDN